MTWIALLGAMLATGFAVHDAGRPQPTPADIDACMRRHPSRWV